MATRAQYIAKLRELAHAHPDAPVVDREGYPLALTPAQCVGEAERAPAGVPVGSLPRLREPTEVERRRGVTGKVLVTG